MVIVGLGISSPKTMLPEVPFWGALTYVTVPCSIVFQGFPGVPGVTGPKVSTCT